MPDTIALSPSAGSMPVSLLVRQARALLEATLPLMWISGEISNLTRAGSGHVYFTLKDHDGQLRCAMWRNRAQLLAFQLKEGMHVEVRAQLTIYEPRGDLQLSVEHIRQAGLGNLFEALLRLKSRLEAEGLFAAARKRPLPRLPQGVAIITSLKAAAWQDVLITLRRRAPALHIVVYPCPVQGEGAAAQIAASIRQAGQRQRLDGTDVMIVCRGGGSMEDLWAFNDEAVVRAIHAAPMPVVCGVGHESDSTLCELAADLRCATPTAAAEAVSAGIVSVREALPALARRLQQSVTMRIQRAAQGVDGLEHRLIHPRERLARLKLALKALDLALHHAHERRISRHGERLNLLQARLRHHAPRTADLRSQTKHLQHALEHAFLRRLKLDARHLNDLSAQLESLNPQRVLKRGYAIVRDEAQHIIKHSTQISAGQTLHIQLADGEVLARTPKAARKTIDPA